MSLGQRLTAARKEKGLSNREVAKAAGVSSPTVDRMMKDIGRPQLDNVDRVARALSVPIAEARKLAGFPPVIDGPYEGPIESRLLSPRQRAALDELIRSITLVAGNDSKTFNVPDWRREAPEEPDDLGDRWPRPAQG